jgi:alkylation response protein AidB-like acyl-CoA dehydrogenase
MNFEMTKSQREIQKAARDFVKGEFDKDLALNFDRSGNFPKQIWKKAVELGFIGIHFPEKFSGGGLGVIENVLVAEEFCKKDSTIGAAIMLSSFATEYLLRFGSDRQKEQFLTPVAEGKTISGSIFGTLPLATGEYPCALKTNDGWRICGEFDHVANGGQAGFFCVPCAINSKDGKSDGLNIFLIESRQKGVAFGENEDKLGLRMTPTTKMILTDVEISQENQIGKENSGQKQIDRVLGECCVLISAIALGTAQGAFERSLSYVKQRIQFGKKIVQFQVTRHKLVVMAAQIEQARYLTYCAATSFDSRDPNTYLSALAKLTTTRTAVAVASEAIQLLGGYGYMKEYEVERFYRDAKTLQLMAGDTDRLKDVIAENIVGRIK